MPKAGLLPIDAIEFRRFQQAANKARFGVLGRLDIFSRNYFQRGVVVYIVLNTQWLVGWA